MTVRGELLADAKEAIEGDRNKDYGSAAANFGRTAALWNAWTETYDGEAGDNQPYTPSDVAVFMILVKVARLAESSKRDTWQDIAGYAACGYETARAEVPDSGALRAGFRASTTNGVVWKYDGERLWAAGPSDEYVHSGEWIVRNYGTMLAMD